MFCAGQVVEAADMSVQREMKLYEYVEEEEERHGLDKIVRVGVGR